MVIFEALKEDLSLFVGNSSVCSSGVQPTIEGKVIANQKTYL